MACSWNLDQRSFSHWKIVTIDRAYTASYQSAIVSVALSRTMFELFDIEEYCDLEI